VTEPPKLVAVNVYVVVEPGVTEIELPDTVPGPGVTLNVVAPVTDQFNVALCPAWTL
jgi:hypothetical protein